jgi:serine acetyltransferase/GT2 family glycosyltransferase
MIASAPALSVVIATYNRAASAERLLRELAEQSLPPHAYEVIVVDDGSAEPVAPRLAGLAVPYALRVVRQENAGPAAARDTGIQAAAAEVIVLVDDDMIVGPEFLAGHLDAHPPGSRRVVLGRLRTEPGVRMPLFERYHQEMLDRLAERARADASAVRGVDLYTGNVSLRRDDYLLVGGFDQSLRLSEDAELGLRLEAAGVSFGMSEEASSVHASDHVSVVNWMRRSLAYGAADARIAEKHAEMPAIDPWRFLFMVHRVSRPILLACAALPRLMGAAAWLVVLVAVAAAAVGAERAAVAGMTLAYGMQYFRGVRAHAGSRRRAMAGLRAHVARAPEAGLGRVALAVRAAADLRADHAAVLRTDAKYKARVQERPSLAGDAVQRIGLQMMLAYRVMRYLRLARFRLLAKLASRLIRHLYSADIHWDAELAPGVMIVHGLGLVVSHAARVAPGCILFHHVTLGESIDPDTREIGSPTLEANVHVGPGATLLGPVTIGQGTKITAGALLMQSVPPQSLVETPAPTIRRRGGGARPPVRGVVPAAPRRAHAGGHADE